MEDSVEFQLFKKTATIGNYLSDHLSWRIFTIKESCKKSVISNFSNKFVDGIMRSIHFLNVKSDSNAPRYYGHLVFFNKNLEKAKTSPLDNTKVKSGEIVSLDEFRDKK